MRALLPERRVPALHTAMTIRSESVIHLHRRPPEARRPAWQRYGLTLAICAAPVLLARPLYGRIDAANLVMLFLLAVVAVAATRCRAR